jgi:hypothetical protein
MRLHPYVIFGVDQPALDEIVLTSAERATLRRAAAILEGVRDLRNSRVPTDWYAGEEDDCDLAFGQRIADELATTGRIDAETVR